METVINTEEISLDDDEDIELLHEKLREWADEKGFHFVEKTKNENPETVIKVGSRKYMIVDAYGNTILEENTFLGGENGQIKLTDNSVIVTNDSGERSIINENSFPTGK